MTYTEQPSSAGGPAAQPPRSLRRSTDNRVFAGVAGGLAEYVGADPLAIRVAFVVASILLGGIGGPLVYGAAWLVIPEQGHATSIAAERLGSQPWA